ncbi:MAG: IS4 family transposase [Myxococcaceae bacterium]
MGLEEAFSAVPGFLPGNFDQFARHLNPEWIEDALIATGTASMRRRRLPADQVLWLVVGMALMRNESIERVAALLSIALPSTTGRLVAPSALAQARQRLGDEPVEYVFSATGAEWSARSAEAHRWRGLGLYALDGSTIRVPDSYENWTEFGGQDGNGKRAGSAYPTVRVVGLMAVRSHTLAAMRIGTFATGEVSLAREIWPAIPNDSLTIVDRNFLVAADLNQLCGDGTNRHWLTRAKRTTHLKTLQRFGPGDELVEIQLSAETRRVNPGLPKKWVARAIRYERKGFPPSTLLTSLTDAAKYPRKEVVGLYHERWEIELGYDEIKTHMLAREEAIRSRKPTGVRQELWAIGLAYNLVRVEMERAADEAGVPPTRISFVNALSMICHAWVVWSTPPQAPGRIPAALTDLRQRLRLLLLPERRPERTFPRAVKIKMSNYDKKWTRRSPPK